MSRFTVIHNGKTLGALPSMWEAHEAAVAYMRAHLISPVAIWDSESKQPIEFQTSYVHIQSYEGPREVVEARALLRSHNSY